MRSRKIILNKGSFREARANLSSDRIKSIIDNATCAEDLTEDQISRVCNYILRDGVSYGNCTDESSGSEEANGKAFNLKISQKEGITVEVQYVSKTSVALLITIGTNGYFDQYQEIVKENVKKGISLSDAISNTIEDAAVNAGIATPSLIQLVAKMAGDITKFVKAVQKEAIFLPNNLDWCKHASSEGPEYILTKMSIDQISRRINDFIFPRKRESRSFYRNRRIDEMASPTADHLRTYIEENPEVYSLYKKGNKRTSDEKVRYNKYIDDYYDDPRFSDDDTRNPKKSRTHGWADSIFPVANQMANSKSRYYNPEIARTIEDDLRDDTIFSDPEDEDLGLPEEDYDLGIPDPSDDDLDFTDTNYSENDEDDDSMFDPYYITEEDDDYVDDDDDDWSNEFEDN